MGGLGSGRYGWRHRLEHYPALRLRDLHALRPGRSARAEWPSLEVAASLAMFERCPRIDFENPERGYFGGAVEIVNRPAGFGGWRRFFLCPHCARARTAIYLRRGRFRCRECHGLRYLSQTRDYSSRQHDAMAKLEARLNEDGTKPKRMRWSTFDRICDRLQVRDDRLGVDLALLLVRKGMLNLDEYLSEDGQF